MIKTIGQINYKAIPMISPSQFSSLQNCAYKIVLGKAFNNSSLLPVSADAHFGTVLHKMLELIAKRIITNEDDLNAKFIEEVLIQEQILKKAGYEFLIPFQKKIKNFGLKQILLTKQLRYSNENHGNSKLVKYYAEKWLESVDKLIGGRIDLITEDEKQTEITEFKTGAITQDIVDDNGYMTSEIKTEYQTQLKLYAYLFFSTHGKYPTRLTIMDLTRRKFSVTFTIDECTALAEEARSLLKKVNENISSNSFSANPSESNCKYCLYRPACSFYLEQLNKDEIFNDATGTIKDVIRYNNGNVSVFLDNGKKKIVVTGLEKGLYQDLMERKNLKIAIFNLRKVPTNLIYSATKTTTIYK